MAKKKVISRKEVVAQLEELVKLVQETPKFIIAKRSGKDSVPDVWPDTLQELITFLRMGIKYQLFDLNAYRLEVLYLRKLCKENNIDV